MVCLQCFVFINCLLMLHSQGSGLACNIHEERLNLTKVKHGCTVTVSYNFTCLDRIKEFKVKEGKEGMLNSIICTITYTRGECDGQTGCTCGAHPHTVTVTRQYRQSQHVELDAVAFLQDGKQKSTHLTANCEQSEKTDDVTEESPNQPSVNEASTTVLIAVGVSTSLAVVVVVIGTTLIIGHRRSKARATIREFAMSAPQEPRPQNDRQPQHDTDAVSVMHNNSFYVSRSVCGEYADVHDTIQTVRAASRTYEGGRVYDEIQDSDSEEEGATGGQDMYVDPFDVKKKKAAQGKNPGMRPMTRK